MGRTDGLPDELSDEDAAHFPNLERANYAITSPKNRNYNCIAYAAGDEGRWWEPVDFPFPGYFWPKGAERGTTLDALKSCYATQGYEVCDDGEPEEGCVKIALYAAPDGSWTHAARQLDEGGWTSKLGKNVDIRHKTPGCVGGSVYGVVAVFMRKQV